MLRHLWIKLSASPHSNLEDYVRKHEKRAQDQVETSLENQLLQVKEETPLRQNFHTKKATTLRLNRQTDVILSAFHVVS
jgi:hypothetical protein